MRRCVAFLVALAATYGIASAGRVPVAPGELVEVSFVAAVEKGPVVEDDPALVELLPISTGRPGKTGAKFAAAEWRFLDAAGNRLRHAHVSNDRVTLFSRKPRRFAFRVYVPENAASVEVVPAVLADGDRVRIGGLAAKAITRGEILNQNHDFSADDASLPGWQLSGAARFARDGEGRPYALLEDGGVFGDPFPVRGGQTLAVTLKAAPPRYATRKHIPWGAIHFYDSYEASAAKDQPFARPKLSVHSVALDEKTETYKVPASARWCRIVVRVGSVYGCAAREVE